MMPLLALTNERLGHNYDLYEFSIVPEKLPGGGGFSIKNFSLNTLYSEHSYCRNVWTKTNIDRPLVRYTGCTFKFYQSEHIDYIVTYDTQLPLRSNLDMYQTMQPNIHNMLQNKILIPSRKTRPQKKPYTKVKIKPTTQLMNKWYFQQDLAKTPLVQIRTTAISLDEYYQKYDSVNSNITITYLTPTIQNRNFKINPPGGYSNRTQPAQGTLAAAKVYLYATRENNLNTAKLKSLIFLGQTTHYSIGDEIENHKGNYTKDHWGNPFHETYLHNDEHTILQSTMTVATLQNQNLEQTIASQTQFPFSQVHLTAQFRYNPMRDDGRDNEIYIYPIYKDGEGWDPPTDNLFSQTISSGLPFWLLPYGYTDFMLRAHAFGNFETDHIVVLRTKINTITTNLPIISSSMLHGTSPYENTLDNLDRNRWYPSIQFQLEELNNIISTGPGIPKIPDKHTVQCKTKYTFYFKWGGNLPPMSSIQDPTQQPTYPLPNNFKQTITLQNPETNPEYILYSFDERRGQLTERAIKRILQDRPTKTTFISDSESRHIPPVQTTQKETSQESSEEEETTETLLNQLHQQRQQQRRLKQLILQKMNILNIE